jgi:hypothetical protein
MFFLSKVSQKHVYEMASQVRILSMGAELFKVPPWDLTMEARRRESQMVICDCVASVLQQTRVTPRQVSMFPPPDFTNMMIARVAY